VQAGGYGRALTARVQRLSPGSRVSRRQQVRLTGQTYGEHRCRSDLRIGGHRLRGGCRDLQ
jgi:hypothetical protein